MLKLIILATIVVVLPTYAQRTGEVIGMSDTTDVIDHTRFDSLWHESLEQGKMRTSGVNSECYATYRQALAGAYPPGFHPNARFAFWVNAYLACCMQVIHERVGYRATVWDRALCIRDTFEIAEANHTLKDLADSVMKIARTCRAVVFLCTGSSNGPPFPSHAQFAKTVQRSMREQIKRVCRSERYVLYDPAGNALQLAAMFQPFEQQMIAEAGSLAQWVLPYVTNAVAAQMALQLSTLRTFFSDRIETWRKAR